MQSSSMVELIEEVQMLLVITDVIIEVSFSSDFLTVCKSVHLQSRVEEICYYIYSHFTNFILYHIRYFLH